MEQQDYNVGGQVAGSAQSVPSQQFGAQPSVPGMPRSGHAPQPGQYASGQPSAATSQGQDSVGQNANNSNNDVSSTTVNIAAEDSDLIEKEWVEKAKAIVEKTRKDPFRQSLELNQLKADYLQKRYGKNVGSDGQ